MSLRVLRDQDRSERGAQVFEVIQASGRIMNVTVLHNLKLRPAGFRWQVLLTVLADGRWTLFNGSGETAEAAYDDAVRQLSMVGCLGPFPNLTFSEWTTITNELLRQGAFDLTTEGVRCS